MIGTLKIIFSEEFITHIREHSDLIFGYWFSIASGTGGLTLIFTNPVWEFVGVVGGIILTFCSIMLTIMLTVKAWWGYKKVKAEVIAKLLANTALEIQNQKDEKDNE